MKFAIYVAGFMGVFCIFDIVVLLLNQSALSVICSSDEGRLRRWTSIILSAYSDERRLVRVHTENCCSTPVKDGLTGAERHEFKGHRTKAYPDVQTHNFSNCFPLCECLPWSPLHGL